MRSRVLVTALLVVGVALRAQLRGVESARAAFNLAAMAAEDGTPSG